MTGPGPTLPTWAVQQGVAYPGTPVALANVIGGAPVDPKVALIDHLVGDREQRRRHVEAEGSCGLEVDEQFEPGRKLHRQVAGLLTFEDAIDVAGDPRV